MSGNRFADCETVEHVLRSLLPIEPPELWDALEADALARIAELTRPVVDEAARERAISIVRQWFSDPNSAEFAQLVDRIIADLGYKLIYSDDDVLTINKHHHPASAPAVELDAEVLRSMIGIVEAHQQSPITLGPMQLDAGLGVPTVIDDTEIPGVSVLRIGGGDE